MLEPSRNALLFTAVGVILLAPIAWRIASRRFDPFEPLFWFSLAFGVMFVIRPIASLVNNEFTYDISGKAPDVSRGFTEMLLLGLMGAVGFLAGYALPAGRRTAHRLPRPPTQFRPTTITTLAVASGLLGLILFLFFLLTSGGLSQLTLVFAGRSEHLTRLLTSAPTYFTHGPFLLIPAALLLVVVGTERRDRRVTLLGVAAAGALFLIEGPIGQRLALFPLFAAFGIWYYARRVGRPGPVAITLFTIAVLFVSSFLLTVRNAPTRQEQGTSGVLGGILHAPGQVTKPLTSGQDSAEALALAASLEVVPEDISYTHGGALILDPLLRPVPRSLWPAKPLPPRERVIARLWGRFYYRGAANPEFTIVFYPYMDFGPLGVLFVLGLYGVAARILYEYFRKYEHLLAAQVLFAVTLPVFGMALRDSPADTLERGVLIIAPIWIAFALGTKREKAATARGDTAPVGR